MNLNQPKNLSVLFEDNHLIIINKKCGELVQGDRTGDQPLSEKVKEFIKEKYDKPGNVYLGVTHRLDRPTSGIVVFAKTSKALSRMNKLFADDEVEKTYWALTRNRPPKKEDTLTHFLKRNSRQNKSYAHTKKVPGSKKAILKYKIIQELNHYFLLEIKLITGRHHQIRSQLSKIGCPIRGDLKYGFPRSNPDGGISLHARYISFIHPVRQERVSITAPAPANDNLWAAVQG